MSGKRKPWKKNLYENQGYEDNYTDPSFLKDLQKNINLKVFTFHEAFRGACRLSLQVSTVTLFLVVFYYLYDNRVSPQLILFYSSLATIIGYLYFVGRDLTFATIMENSRTGICVLLFGYIFSPLLHTLTDSISTDTIFSTTGVVMFLHVVFFDYGISAFIVSRAISLNAAIFGAICLASRLSSSLHAFVLLTLSTVFFALIPILMEKLWHPWWVIPITMICSYFLYTISMPILVTYLVVLFFLNLVCPYLFVQQQKNKNNIYGPWDEAIVDDSGLQVKPTKKPRKENKR